MVGFCWGGTTIKAIPALKSFTVWGGDVKKHFEHQVLRSVTCVWLGGGAGQDPKENSHRSAFK